MADREHWAYNVNFTPDAPADEVRRICYWIGLLLHDENARKHMAAYGAPPANFKLPPLDRRRRRAAEVMDLVNLATDEEIDDFGE